MAAVTICSDSGAQENKGSHCFPSICHEVMGPDAMILALWMLSFFFFFKSNYSHLLLLFFFKFVVDFVIHWNETAKGLHVFPIPIPPPTSLSTRSL